MTPCLLASVLRGQVQGDFEQLLIVRIDQEFRFKGKLFDRSELIEAAFALVGIDPAASFDAQALHLLTAWLVALRP